MGTPQTIDAARATANVLRGVVGMIRRGQNHDRDPGRRPDLRGTLHVRELDQRQE